MSNTSTSTAQISWIAALRGLSALLVFVSHMVILPVDRSVLFVLGRMGVVAFFLISGYLTVQSRIKRNRKQYFFNRFVRVYPVFWILLLITWGLRYGEISIPRLIANMTLFEEFLGIDIIIGASWMLPIQVAFYFCIMVFDMKFIIKKLFSIEVILSVVAIISGILRFVMGKPFPTAFFLLIGVAVLGIQTKETDEANPDLKTRIIRLLPMLCVFEIGLAVSTVLSYRDEWIFYEIAYNCGIILFLLFDYFNKSNGIINRIFDEIGKAGFTFFLGAEIPVLIIEKFVSLNEMNVALSLLIRFVTAFVFAKLITILIEKPLLNAGKKLESKLA